MTLTFVPNVGAVDSFDEMAKTEGDRLDLRKGYTL